MTDTPLCQVRRLHVVTYENGMMMQEKLVAQRQRDEIPDQFLLLEHPPVITLGRGGDSGHLVADPEELARRGVRFYETTRGGDITWHGPGQLVGYPILHLGEGRRDVRKLVTRIEEVLIRTLADFGIRADRVDGQRGVWAGPSKIGAVGIRIARWVTSHGFALNVSPDLGGFSMIVPCGIQGARVASIESLTGLTPPRHEVTASVLRHFGEVFERHLIEQPHDMHLVKVLIHDGGDRILLLHRHPHRGGFWQPITGTIEPAEAPFEAAKREILEETGSAGAPVEMDLRQSFVIDSPWVHRRFGRAVFADEITYHARLDPDTPVRVDAEEHDSHGWFTFHEALEMIQWTDDREAIERLQRMLPACHAQTNAGSANE